MQICDRFRTGLAHLSPLVHLITISHIRVSSMFKAAVKGLSAAAYRLQPDYNATETGAHRSLMQCHVFGRHAARALQCVPPGCGPPATPAAARRRWDLVAGCPTLLRLATRCCPANVAAACGCNCGAATHRRSTCRAAVWHGK